jgi:hypothetical protein
LTWLNWVGASGGESCFEIDDVTFLVVGDVFELVVEFLGEAGGGELFYTPF